MFAYLEGQLKAKLTTEVWLDCNGVGYELKISLHTYSKLPKEGKALLYCHLQVREDAHVLFGFADVEERALFRQLISVSGVGATTALLMLSSMGPEQLVSVISSEDVASLKLVKGIGAKTAQRVIVDLKDKVLTALGNEGELPIFAASGNTNKQEALTALEVLGFNRKAADKLLTSLLQENPEISVEDLVKQALKKL